MPGYGEPGEPGVVDVVGIAEPVVSSAAAAPVGMCECHIVEQGPG